MKRKIILIIVFICALVAGGFYELHTLNKKVDETPITTEIPKGNPTFAWKFEEAETLNGDGNPNTNVYLEATYPNGEVEKKLIQVSHASCNELPDTKENNIQCYGAGFGYRFKIVKGENSYLIMKQEFDEGSEDYTPPKQEYKTVAEITF